MAELHIIGDLSLGLDFGGGSFWALNIGRVCHVFDRRAGSRGKRTNDLLDFFSCTHRGRNKYEGLHLGGGGYRVLRWTAMVKGARGEREEFECGRTARLKVYVTHPVPKECGAGAICPI